MALTIKSPHSGNLVKVREQDIGRSIKDEDGKIFYVLPTSDGSGYYSSKTRTGSLEQEQEYAALTPAIIKEQSETKNEEPLQIHDATGKRRRPRVIVVIIVLIILAVIAFLCYSWAVNDIPFYNWQKAQDKPAQVQKDNVTFKHFHVNDS